MFIFFRTVVKWSTVVFKACIGGLEVLDTLVCDWEGITKTPGINDSTHSHIWDVIDTVCEFLCHAYTYNGVGISYSVAREVLSIGEQLHVLQEQYPDTDLGQLYIVYNKTRCLNEVSAAESIFRRLISIGCTDLHHLTVQRTYTHSVFGRRFGDTTLPELTLDAKITLFDIGTILSHVFDSA